MKRIGFLFLVIGILAMGCTTVGPVANESIQKSIELMDSGVRDYVNNAAQPSIEYHIVGLEKEIREIDSDIEKFKDDESRKEDVDVWRKMAAEKRSKIDELKEYLSLGIEIPQTTAELHSWVKDAPLPDQKE